LDQARDGATDQLVNAVAALRSRGYRCAVCNAPVHLRAGSDRRAHFAHVSGKADPECEEYFPSEAPYTGRRPLGGAQEHDGGEGLQRVELFFDLTEAGPILSVSMPPSAGTGSWTGSIDLEAHRVSRRFTNQHLLTGQRVNFELLDGQWLIRANGEVSLDYESRLDLGVSCLESSLNIFDAMHSPAPRMGPTRAARLGEALWVITRQTTINWDTPDASVGLERCASVGGWFVEYVQLPRTASPQAVAQLARWLQRPIRPARACVYVASPWPSAYTSAGVAVYPMIAGGLEIRSDQNADMQLIDEHGQVTAEAPYSDVLRWAKPIAGVWTVVVNNDPFLTFVIADQPPVAGPAIVARVDGGLEQNLFDAQAQLERDGQSSPPHTVIEWKSPGIAHCMRINGTPLDDPETGILEIPAGAWGTTLTAGNFGTLRWAERSMTTAPARSADLRAIYDRARWVLSKALPFESTSGISIRVAKEWRSDFILGALRHRRWSVEFQPHLQLLLRAMDGHR
jgi:hypothetical protein